MSNPTLSCSLALGAVMTLCSCDAPVGAEGAFESDHELRRAPRYDGRELFAGIFFAEGEVAERLPSLQEGRLAGELGEARHALDQRRLQEVLARAERRAQARGFEAGAAALRTAQTQLYRQGLPRGDRRAPGTAAMLAVIEAERPGFFDRFAREVQSGDHVRIAEALQNARDIAIEVWTEVYIPLPGSEEGLALYVETFIAVDLLLVYETVWVGDSAPPLGEEVWEEILVDEIAGQLGV